MSWVELPATAAWRHGTSRDGLETVRLTARGQMRTAYGCTTAVEGTTAWWVAYEIHLDGTGRTRRAQVSTASHVRSLESDGAGRWLIDGEPDPALDGCLDVDLESSALTNAFPVRRAQLTVDEALDAPAAYVRVTGLAVTRLEQRYRRRPDDGDAMIVDYVAPSFDFTAEIRYDTAGLVVAYPGIADRCG